MNGYDVIALAVLAWMVVQLARILAAYRAAKHRTEAKARGAAS